MAEAGASLGGADIALDEDGWVRSIHDAYGGPLFVFAHRALGDADAAEEVVQDTLVRAWRSIDRYDPEIGSLGTWLFAIARNLVIDQRRRRSARARAVEAAEREVEEDDATALERAMDAWQVAEALQDLSLEHRTTIVETYYFGRSVREVSGRLGIPPGTVKSRLYYGLRALRLALEERGLVG